ncbi:DUF4258 domain-containing protein [Patescibacteria group bacterium]|nr:DUF4258 domain-containing protein [Patescibacteria group bacterium]
MDNKLIATSPLKEIKPYFVVKSIFDKNIRTTKSYWDKITLEKHPQIKGKEKIVRQVLKNPDEIRKSKSDNQVCLYYKKYNRYHLCVVIKHLNGDGYIVTAYITSKILEGKNIWKK